MGVVRLAHMWMFAPNPNPNQRVTWHPSQCHRYRGAKIQLLDLPGIIEGAKDGKGRGRQVSEAACTLHDAGTSCVSRPL